MSSSFSTCCLICAIKDWSSCNQRLIFSIYVDEIFKDPTISSRRNKLLNFSVNSLKKWTNGRISLVHKLFTDKHHWLINEHCWDAEEDFLQRIDRNLSFENNAFETNSIENNRHQWNVFQRNHSYCRVLIEWTSKFFHCSHCWMIFTRSRRSIWCIMILIE